MQWSNIFNTGAAKGESAGKLGGIFIIYLLGMRCRMLFSLEFVMWIWSRKAESCFKESAISRGYKLFTSGWNTNLNYAHGQS
jgi:hypothetical protein